ncbi:phosphotransferase [Actinomadura sediminis]|uniref:Phosphotransferase n=1 Tax=Actinomadura sediminis TaxID=1038904 RepID=A0ABW3EPV2_9ACTN
MEWDADGLAHRAELSAYIATPVCSPAPALTERIRLPDAWWARLREAIEAVAVTPSPGSRSPVITQEYIHRAIPRYLGNTGVDTTVTRWSLAHGDLHWANLTRPELTILDWEGFGPAPFGFDAAHLYAYTLPVPEVAADVRRTFADVLATPDGRLAELTVAAMILQAAERDPVHARLAPLVSAHLPVQREQANPR